MPLLPLLLRAALTAGVRVATQPTTAPCVACGKTAYATELVIANGQCFHRPCFRCDICKRPLLPNDYAALNDKFYCKPHFEQAFKVNANYQDGFQGQPAATDASADSGNPSAG